VQVMRSNVLTGEARSGEPIGHHVSNDFLLMSTEVCDCILACPPRGADYTAIGRVREAIVYLRNRLLMEPYPSGLLHDLEGRAIR
jgi:hypothetical protein